MKLSHLLTALPEYALLSGPTGKIDATSQIDITNITSDSRQVGPGALFVAYRGVSLDGHRFIANAIANGAAAIVQEAAKTGLASELSDAADSIPIIVVPNGRAALAYLAAAWHDWPARRLAMVGITGTDGKTTTTNFLYAILQASGIKKVSMINTVNAVIGDSRLDTGLHTTTPDAPDLQNYLAQMVNAGTEVCLLEVTSHGLAQRRVTACDFDVAIVTNITHEHLDVHGSLVEYRLAKAMLFESLATAALKGMPKTAVLNCDDWSFDYLREKLEPAGTAWLGYSVAGHLAAQVTAQERVLRFRALGTPFRSKPFWSAITMLATVWPRPRRPLSSLKYQARLFNRGSRPWQLFPAEWNASMKAKPS
jgi:UDP-N-acetylmuramyl-tripeptide synthetase